MFYIHYSVLFYSFMYLFNAHNLSPFRCNFFFFFLFNKHNWKNFPVQISLQENLSQDTIFQFYKLKHIQQGFQKHLTFNQ